MKFYLVLLAVWGTCLLVSCELGHPSASNLICITSGVVTDAFVTILPFASVAVENSNQSTNTNAKGRFSLDLPEVSVGCRSHL